MRVDKLESQTVAELIRLTPSLTRLGSNEDALGRALEAHQARDAAGLRAVFDQLGIAGFCVWICRWICHWHCFRVCRLFCRELPEKPFEMEELHRYAQALAKLGASADASKQLVDAVAQQDVKAFHAVAEKYELTPFAFPLCYWVCHLHCWRFCRLVCPPNPIPIPNPIEIDPLDEFRQVAEAAGKLAKDRKVFESVLVAYQKGDVAALQAAFDRLQLLPLCIILCRWLCVLHCHRICIRLCRRIPRSFTVPEIREFIVRWRKLADHGADLDRVVAAVLCEDEQTFAALLEKYGLSRYCFWVCQWICHTHCRLYCRIICPPTLDCRIDEPQGCTAEEASVDLKALVVAVRGTASGSGFDHYVLEWSTDDATFNATNFHYPPIPPGGGAQGTSPVVNGLLAYFDTTALDADTYFLRLTVRSKAGGVCVHKVSFDLFKQDVRILAVNGASSLDKPALDPTARLVETVTPKCTATPTVQELAVGGNLSIDGSAFIGGCDEKKIKRYTISYKAGPELDCNAPGWSAPFWEIKYDTVWQYRSMNMRDDTSRLTARWVADCVAPWPFPPYCLNTQPEARLSPSSWNSRIGPNCALSGLFTLKLEVEDVDGNVYCDLQRVWIDNKPVHAHIEVNAVASCADLNLSQLVNPADCSDPWPLSLIGIAYDELIDRTLPSIAPNDNFDHYYIQVFKQGGSPIQIPIDAPDGSCFFGTSRVGMPASLCQPLPGDPVVDQLAQLAEFDLRAIDQVCKPNISYASSVPDSFTLARGQCCVYTFRLRVYDRTHTNSGAHWNQAQWSLKICNDL